MNHRLQLNHERRLAMTFRMQQALTILQMPQMELSQLIQEEIDKNPLLEEIESPKKPVFEQEIASTDSIYENLLRQIRENFPDIKEQQIGQKILENIDEKGFLSVPLSDIGEESDIEKILATMQTFEPAGIFARNLQESLLLQLRRQGSENTPLFTLIRDHYPDLLHGRYSLLKKKCGELNLADAIQKIASLCLRPLDCFKKEIARPLVADLAIRKTQTGWTVGTMDDDLPKFHLHCKYDGIALQGVDEQETLRIWRSQGKWLLNALSRRREILLQIGMCLTRHQNQYLSQKGELKAVTNQEIASQLGLHESTISRAIAGKYVETPRGIIPLKSLLTSSPETKEAKAILQELVGQEDKNSPWTDEELAEELKKRGVPVARRTISKYRGALKIQSAQQRKGFN